MMRTVIVVVIGALETVSKDFEKGELEIGGRAESIQTTAF